MTLELSKIFISLNSDIIVFRVLMFYNMNNQSSKGKENRKVVFAETITH